MTEQLEEKRNLLKNNKKITLISINTNISLKYFLEIPFFKLKKLLPYLTYGYLNVV